MSAALLPLPKPMIRAAALRRRVHALAKQISADHQDGSPLVMLALMDGAFCFVADLARCLHIDVRLHFVRASSYGEHTTSQGHVALGALPEVTGADVLVVDDILDTGRTLAAVVRACAAARRLRSCVLLDKPARRVSEGLTQADFVGFTIPDVFVVGYGLDHAGRFRHLPDVCVLTPAPAT